MSAGVVMAWSGGKDSALALDALKRAGVEILSLLTTVTGEYDRISMHGVRRSLLHLQAESLGLPLCEAVIQPGASNVDYEAAMERALVPFREAGVRTVAFGDLFLEDIRAYREAQMSALNMNCQFPVWGRDTGRLASEFIDLGFHAVVCCVDPRQLDPAFCGRNYDQEFLDELPSSVDPCGENGEFHTLVVDGPIFERPLDVIRGDVVPRDGFWYCDFKSASGNESAAPTTAGETV